MTSNQQTALLQEQLDSLWIVQQVSCSHFYHSACVTTFAVQNISLEVQRLKGFLKGPWNDTFVSFTTTLAHQTIENNLTRTTPIMGEGWWNAMARIGGWVQRWSGALSLAILGFLLAGVGLFILFKVCKVFQHKKLVQKQILLSLAMRSGFKCLIENERA